MQRRPDTSVPYSRLIGGEGIEQKLADGGPTIVGSFRYYFEDDRWEWSPQVARMHGYEPGMVTPTTQLVLAHKHPEDYRQVADTFELVRQTRRAFSSRHRICDVQGNVHHVTVIGDELRDDEGRVIGTYGFYVDLTREEQVHRDQVSAAVEYIADRRSGIDQVKGMLRLIYGLDEVAAFELLKWWSQETNTKLQCLAEQIAADFAGVAHDGTMPSRSQYDNLLLTAHLRLKGHR